LPKLYRAIKIGDLALWVRALLLAEDIDYEELCPAALDTGIDERLGDASRFADSDPKAARAFASRRLTPTWSVDLLEQNGRSLKTEYRMVTSTTQRQLRLASLRDLLSFCLKCERIYNR
jgi:hypothetical protein